MWLQKRRNPLFQPIFGPPRPAPGDETDMTAVLTEFEPNAGRKLSGFRRGFRVHERIIQRVQDERRNADMFQVGPATGAGVVIVNASITVQRRGNTVVEGVEILDRRQFGQRYRTI
jgi:hypothetical protein